MGGRRAGLDGKRGAVDESLNVPVWSEPAVPAACRSCVCPVQLTPDMDSGRGHGLRAWAWGAPADSSGGRGHSCDVYAGRAMP